MNIKFANNATTYLAADIDSDDTTLSVYTGGGALFPTIVETEDYFKITIQDSLGNYEIMHVTAVDGDEFTVTRAQEGTTAKAFSAGAIVENRPTAGFLEEVSNIVYASEAEALAGIVDTKAMSPATTKAVIDASSTAFAKTLLDDTTASEALTTLGVSAYAKTILDDATASDAQTTLGISTYAKTLIDDASASDARTTLGLGSAAILDAGTSANNLVQLTAAAKLPAVDGSLLTNLPAGGLTGMQIFTSSGTFTVPAGVTAARVICVGGGGGSSGARSGYVGGAGGGGSYSEKVVTGLTPGSNVTVTVGAGGTAGAATGDGGNGGTSSFGSYVSAPGGARGVFSWGGNSTSGAGGVATTSGAFNRNGCPGLMGAPQVGGASLLSLPNETYYYTKPNGDISAIAGNPFGGGSIAAMAYSTNLAGAAGGAGIVIVQW